MCINKSKTKRREKRRALNYTVPIKTDNNNNQKKEREIEEKKFMLKNKQLKQG